jgi:hypothetical protein
MFIASKMLPVRRKRPVENKILRAAATQHSRFASCIVNLRATRCAVLFFLLYSGCSEAGYYVEVGSGAASSKGEERLLDKYLRGCMIQSQ